MNWYKKNTSIDIYDAVANLLKNESNDYFRAPSINSTSYFNGEWSQKFTLSDTPYMFYGDKSKKSIKPMCRISRCNYFIGQKSTGVQLDYGNGSFSMVVILPNTASNVAEALDELVAGGLEQMTKVNEVMAVSMPRFEMNETFDLLETLSSLGVDFHDGTYDKLFESATLPFVYFRQHMQVKVNENGTEVKTSTSSSTGWTAAGPREFKVDRSFLWLIKENSTGSILFLGKVGGI